MKAIFCILGAILLFPFSTLEAKRVLISFHVSLDVPDEVQVEYKEGADYDLNYLSRGGTLILMTYDGDHPGFPFGDHAHTKDGPREVTVNGFRAQEVRGEEGTKCRRELLIDLGEGGPHHQFVHVYIPRGTEEDEKLADAIVNSLKFEEVAAPNPSK